MCIVCGDTVQTLGIKFHGVVERKEQPWIVIIPELKNRNQNRGFGCWGYYVDTAGKNADRFKAYIQQQLEEDKQQSMFDK